VKKVIPLLAFACLVTSMALAQPSVRKLVQLGDEALAARHYQTAIEYFLLAKSKAPENPKVKYQLAESYRYTFDYQEAEKYYQQVIDLNSKDYPLAVFYLALTRKMNGKYEQAKRTFDDFILGTDSLEFTGKIAMVAQARLEKEGCDLAIERSSLPFRSFGLTLLPAPVNSPFNDYAAYTYRDDSTIVVTSSRTESIGDVAESSFGEDFTDFFRFSKTADSSWTAFASNDDFYKTNGTSHEGSGSFNFTRTKYYFTRCEGAECAIFVTKIENGRWQPAQKLNDNINPKGTESKHPSLNIGSDTIFFVSNREGTIGQNDIYFSVRQADEQWGPAKNLGDKINTPWNEGSPFFFSKENIMVISSQGHAGYGGFDIFVVKDPFGNQPIVENIGRPFNSEVDELYFMAGNKKGYLSSNRPGGLGNFDIYTFDIRSDESTIASVNNEDSLRDKTLGTVNTFNLKGLNNASITGNIKDCKTGRPLEGIEVLLVDEKGDVVKITSSNNDGHFRFLGMAMNQDYKVVVRGAAISLLDSRDICIDGLKVDGSDTSAVTSRFESIYFDFDRATLRAEAEKTLEELARHCKNNPAIQVEIDGFADAIGTDDYNNKLSFRRGMATFNYLIRLGVDRSSLVVIAKGESGPAAPNTTARGRQLNRRVEFVIKGGTVSPISRIYVVEKRMTLSSLARKYNTSVDEIRRLNGLSADYVEANKPLRLPISTDVAEEKLLNLPGEINPAGTQTYTVKKGDTVFSISVSHNMTVERFMEINNLGSNTIHVGQKVSVEQPADNLVRNPHP
jgi:peptidoglycan-associated lipoprotein